MGGEGKVRSRRVDCVVFVAHAASQHANRAPKVSLDTLENFYEATRIACEEAKNEVSMTWRKRELCWELPF